MDVASVAPYRDLGYEWVAAVATFAVDPSHRANARIADLDLAPRDADGKVRFRSDVRILRPSADPTGRALVVVPNRGMVGGIPFSLDVAAQMGPTEDPDPGDGFLLRRGWTIAWCGWQWDVVRGKGWLGMDAPEAPVEPGWMRVEFRPDVTQSDHRLSDSSPLFEFTDYPAARLDDEEARLTVRTTPLGGARLIPRDSWRLTEDARVVLDGGFQAFHWYELVYRSSFAPVVGAGLLATRDFSAWLRGSHERVFSYGVSQSGRFLRQFLFDGLNVDEDGEQVFDGVFTHIAGARRGEFNCRYGQPSLTHPMTPGYGPPYDTAGLLALQRTIGGVPKLFSTNSSAEYWRGDGALVHQHPDSGEDLPEEPEARTFLLSGTDHFGASPMKDLLPLANPVHRHDPTPVLRSLFVQLEQWASDGVEPPASRVPRRRDASIAERGSVLGVFHDVALPDPDVLPVTPTIDPVTHSWPLDLGEPKVALVSSVDVDGCEVAGVRLPVVAAAAWAYTGWNPRAHVEGLPDVLYEFAGSRLPLQSARRLAGRTDFERAAARIATLLVEDGLLLEEDAVRTVDDAITAYDQATGGG
jgi:hypothetical protein